MPAGSLFSAAGVGDGERVRWIWGRLGAESVGSAPARSSSYPRWTPIAPVWVTNSEPPADGDPLDRDVDRIDVEVKGVSSMKLHRDLDITQKTAWFMLHRIREAWQHEREAVFDGPVEADEAYFGGKRRNMSNAKRNALKKTGRGAVGKTAVAGVKDRGSKRISAAVVERTDGATMRELVTERTDPAAVMFTDEASAYLGVPRFHASVKHSRGEYVRGEVYTNGIESFWALLKRAYVGTYHHMSEKHLDRYVKRFSGCNNIRDLDTIGQMGAIVRLMTGKRIRYADLTAR